MGMSSTSILLGVVLAASSAPAAAAGAEASSSAARGWELVGNMGRIKTVYVDPARIKDKALLASAVKEILDGTGRHAPVEINFFVDRQSMPDRVPFPPETRTHLRAKFNFNPANGLKRFVWVEPADPKDATRKPKYTEDTLTLE